MKMNTIKVRKENEKRREEKKSRRRREEERGRGPKTSSGSSTFGRKRLGAKTIARFFASIEFFDEFFETLNTTINAGKEGRGGRKK